MNKDDDEPFDPSEPSEPTERAALDAWSAPEPPADFAERVLAARTVRREPPRRARALVGALLLVATAAVWLFAVRSGDGSGQAALESRASLLLGRRGVAVAEAGARLSWQVKSGEARVRQSAGDVFYRVEHGGAFVVSTPAGDVTVQGTCFRVEVDPMVNKQWMMAAGVGAVAATTLLVTVYEGRVLLANEHGKTSLSAGEQASARAGDAPSSAWSTANAATQQKSPAPTMVANLDAPSESATRDELLKRDSSQRAELEKLRARVHDLEQPAGKNGQKKDGDHPFFEPTKDELAALAKDCKLKWDVPNIGLQPMTVTDKRAAQLGLSDQERAEMNQVTAEENTRVLAQLRALYVEVTGDKAGADSLTPAALENEIVQKSPEDVMRQVFFRLSHERAGLAAPPANLTGAAPGERLMRLMTGLGDDYEQKLGAQLGPDRAHQLRAEQNGWDNRSQSAIGCPGE